MKELETIDIDNNHCKFQYEIEYGDELNPDKVHFKVFSIPKNEMRWFTYTFRLIDDSTAKGEMMTNNGYAEFSKKGIPEKIIEIASGKLKRTIVSSPTTPKAGNYLVGPSCKVWERLTANNENAIFNEPKSRFQLNYTANQNN